MYWSSLIMGDRKLTQWLTISLQEFVKSKKIQHYLLKKSVRGCFSYRQLEEIFV